MTKGPDTHSESFSGLWVLALTSTQTSPTRLLIAGVGLQAGLGVEVTCNWRRDRNPANYMVNKRTKYLAYVENTQNNSKKTPNNSIRKWTRDVNRYRTKVDMQVAKKHIKKQSALLAIRQVQINTTMWYHYTPIRINFLLSDKYWWGYRETGSLTYFWWKCRMLQTFWKTISQFLKKYKYATTVW